jgi:hypothetical protein
MRGSRWGLAEDKCELQGIMYLHSSRVVFADIVNVGLRARMGVTASM